MRYTDSPRHSFDTDNRAYQRLRIIASDHFESITWSRDDGRPTLWSLYDISTGDVFTVAIVDSIEAAHTYGVLALHRDDTLTIHGPFDDESAAAQHTPALSTLDSSITAMVVLPLHHPDTDQLPDDRAWRLAPPHISPTEPAPTTPQQAALILVNTREQRLCAIGPFPDRATASSWMPPASAGDLTRVVVTLHPRQPIPPTS